MLFRSSALVALLSLVASASAGAVHIDAAGNALEARAVKTCKGTGQFPIPQNGKCVTCASKFSGAATCTTTKATKCSTGVLSAGKCVTTCPASSYNNSGVCATCSSKFTNSATCTSTGATKCASGYLSNGKCLVNCPNQMVNVVATKTCAPCTGTSGVLGATTCVAGKVTACSAGYFVNAQKTGCTPCTTLDKNALTCTSSTVLTCAATWKVSNNQKSCSLGSGWSYYLASSIPNMDFASVQTTPMNCGRNAVANAQPLAQYDPDSDNCYEAASVNSTAIQTLVWDADNTVFVYGSCATNNKWVPTDAKARCYDAVMTATACTLTASQQACTTLLNECDGDQFRNYNGQCQDCQAVYDDALTCDIYNGATTCIDGDYVLNGACASCTAFDTNAATCTADGQIQTCNYGYAPSTDGTSCEVSAAVGNGMLSNNWAYYMDSYVTGGTAFVGDGTIANAVDCAEQAFGANYTLSAYSYTYAADGTTVTGQACYTVLRTDTLVGAIAAVNSDSVYVMGTCADNSAAATDDANSVCYDVNLTQLACTMDDGSNCQ